MDYFSLCLDALYLGGMSVVHMVFACRLTGKKLSPWSLAAYFSLLCVIQLAFTGLCPGCEAVSTGAGVLALYGVSRLALGDRKSVV